MSTTNARLKIFEALTIENPPPIPVNDDTVLLSEPTLVVYDPIIGHGKAYNTKITVAAQPNSGYDSEVDVFYTRNDLGSFLDNVVYISDLVFTPQSLVDALNLRHQFNTILTLDDLASIDGLNSVNQGITANITLTARDDSLAWYGSVTVQVLYKTSIVPNPTYMQDWTFPKSLIWNVKHGLNTRNFIERLRNSDGVPLYAFVNVLSENEFQIEFTEPEEGHMTVVFLLNNG